MPYTSFKLTPSQKGFIFENHDKMTQREIIAAIHISTRTLKKFLDAHGLKLKGAK